MRRQAKGFTLIEVLVVMSLAGILMTLGALALRTFWFNHALGQSASEVTVQLRSLSGKASSDSHPHVFGAVFEPGAETYEVIRYQAAAWPARGVCEVVAERGLGTGVVVESAAFAPSYSAPPEHPQYLTSGATGDCRTQLALDGSEGVAFMFARGTATEGEVLLRQVNLNRCRVVSLSALTARADEEVVTCP